MEDIEVRGITNFMGMDIPNIYGGFGEGKKSITDKMIAEIHNKLVKNIRRDINDNIDRFIEKIDYIDLKNINTEDNDSIVVHGMNDNLKLLQLLGYSKMEISKAEHIYLLSERGYMKLVSAMSNSDSKKWETMDRFIDEYFTMKEVENSKKRLIADTFYDSIFAPTQEERILKTKLFGELKEEYGREEQKKLDEQLLIEERTTNYLPTVDLIKNLEVKNIFSKCLFEALENLGYGQNLLVNKNTRFAHNDKFKEDFIETGLCRCSVNNRYTWNTNMIGYIKNNTNNILDLMKYYSTIISQDVEKNKKRNKKEGYTLTQTMSVLNGCMKEGRMTSIDILKRYLHNIKWLEDDKVTKYAIDNDYAYMYYKTIKIKEQGLNKLINIFKNS